MKHASTPAMSRLGSGLLLAMLLAIAPGARATTWEIRITAPAVSWSGESLGSRTATVYYDPAELFDPCCPSGGDVCCFEGGPFGFSFTPRTVIGTTVLHYSILTSQFVFNPYEVSSGLGEIAGSWTDWVWGVAGVEPGFGTTYVDDVTVSRVPESSSSVLMALGLAGMVLSRQRKSRQAGPRDRA